MDPTKKELYTAKRSSGVVAEEGGEVITALQLLSSSEWSGNDGAHWVLTRVEAGSNPIVKLVSTSQSTNDYGLSGLAKNLSDDELMFAFVRVPTSSAGGDSKTAHVYFVGSGVGAMKRGKGSLYKTGVFDLLPAHGEVSVPDGLSEDPAAIIRSELCRLWRISEADMTPLWK